MPRADYDLLVVGCGLFGCVVAHEAVKAGLRVLAIDRRNHIGGNCYTERMEGIDVHVYGPHIFHTSDESIRNYLGQFGNLKSCSVQVMANYQDELYHLPFNMSTFRDLWGCGTPAEARVILEAQRVPCVSPRNLEDYALSLVGRDIYERLIKGYTEKRWGKPCSELPQSVMRRIPLRFTFDGSFFYDAYQAVPEDGYTAMFERMLEGVEVRLGVDYLQERERLSRIASCVVYSGAIDEYYDYCFGPLEYRSLHFDHNVLDEENHQGCAVVNYTDAAIPFMRCVEHKHFVGRKSDRTVVSYEFVQPWCPGIEPYYPMEDDENRARYDRYRDLAVKESSVFFGGRLGDYRYYDMHETVEAALATASRILSLRRSRQG